MQSFIGTQPSMPGRRGQRIDGPRRAAYPAPVSGPRSSASTLAPLLAFGLTGMVGAGTLGCDQGNLGATEAAVDAASLSARASAIAAEHVRLELATACSCAPLAEQPCSVAEPCLRYPCEVGVALACEAPVAASGEEELYDPPDACKTDDNALALEEPLAAGVLDGDGRSTLHWALEREGVALVGPSVVPCAAGTSELDIEHRFGWCAGSAAGCVAPDQATHPTNHRIEAADDEGVTLDGTWYWARGTTTWAITSIDTRVLYGEAVPRSGTDIVEAVRPAEDPADPPTPTGGQKTTITWVDLGGDRVEVEASASGHSWTFTVMPKP